MTAHLRARAVQAGALLALVGGLLAVAPAAALAVQPTVSIDSLPAESTSGSVINLKYTITNKNAAGGETSAQVTVAGTTCAGECSGPVTVPPQSSVTRNAQLTAPTVNAGQTKIISVQVTVAFPSDTKTVNGQVTVRGADKPRFVRQISGRVKDSGGKALAGAVVGARDSTGAEFEETTNADGGYAITSTDAKPIAVGAIVVGAGKAGYKQATVTVQGAADKSINVPLTLTAIAAAPSVSPSVTPSATVEPSDEVTDDATEPTDGGSAAVLGPTDTAGKDSGNGSLLLIIVGGLLVAAGIGAIVLVILRRRSHGEPTGPDAPDGAVPSGPGRFNTPDATRVGAPGGSNANDATMIAELPAQPSLADAPTMLQQAVPAEDEFPDPYGAPAVTPGNYAGPGGWGTTSAGAPPGAFGGATTPAPAGAYGGAAAGAPAGAYSGAAAGAPAGAYGGAAGGGGPAGSYGGPAAGAPVGAPAGAYGGAAPAGAYGGAAGGYGGQQYDGAGGAPAQADGYAADQYGQQPEEAYGAYAAGQYGGAAEQQRFDEPTGMYRAESPAGYQPDQAGYDQAAYEQAGYAQGGYAQGGYDQGGQQPAAYPAQQYGQPAYDQGGYGGGQEPTAFEPEYPPVVHGGYQGYGVAAEPAGDQGGYGSWDAPAGGAENSYGPQPGNYGAPAGGYAPGQNGYAPEQPGYPAERNGYAPEQHGYAADQQGYDQAGGFGGYQQPGGDGYGAAADQDGYYGGEQESTGRHGGQPRQQQPPEPTYPAQRRQGEWRQD